MWKVVRSALWWRWIAALVLGLAVSLLPVRARALELTWSAPPECSALAAERTRIEQQLARQGLGATALVVTGTVTHEQAHYRLSLRIATASHEAVRAVQLSDCAAVDQAVLAFIEMAVEPTFAGATPNKAAAPTVPAPSGRLAPNKRGAGTTGPRQAPTSKRAAPRGQESTPTSTPEAEATQADALRPNEPGQPAPPDAAAPPEFPAPQPEAATQRASAQLPTERAKQAERAADAPVEQDPKAAREVATRRTVPRVTSSFVAPGATRSWGRLAALVGVWSGGLPRPQVDTGVRAGLGRGALYGELRADWMLPRSDRLDWDATGKVRIRSFALGLAGCAALGAWADRVRVGPCARLSVLRSVGAVRQITAPRDDQVVWLVSALSALLGVRLFGPLELSVEAGAGLPLSPRPRFSVSGRGTAQEARLFSLHATLGVGVRWEQKRGEASQNPPAPPIGR